MFSLLFFCLFFEIIFFCFFSRHWYTQEGKSLAMISFEKPRKMVVKLPYFFNIHFPKHTFLFLHFVILFFQDLQKQKLDAILDECIFRCVLIFFTGILLIPIFIFSWNSGYFFQNIRVLRICFPPCSSFTKSNK